MIPVPKHDFLSIEVEENLIENLFSALKAQVKTIKKKKHTALKMFIISVAMDGRHSNASGYSMDMTFI